MKLSLNPFLLSIVLITANYSVFAQEEWEEGELESVQIEIVKERQIDLPAANRNFEKVPPRPAEVFKAPIQYDFRPFSFQTPHINPSLRPLRLKDSEPSPIFKGHVSAGYGNYSSPYLEGFFNSGKSKDKLVGAHVYMINSGQGPVDGKNSGSGTSGASLYAKSFNNNVSFEADMSYENRSTHFYGYTPGTVVESSDIRQAYNDFTLSAGIFNTRNTSFSYDLGGSFSYLADRYDARETQVAADLNASYAINPQSSFELTADYMLLSRSDESIEVAPRSLLSANPRLVFYIVEDLRISAGVIAAFENDTIGSKDVHAYPDIRISYPLSPSVDVVAALTGGIEKVSLHSLSRENMWLDANIPIYHTNRLYDLQAALHSRIGNKVTVNGGFSFAGLRNWYYYVNDSTDQSRFVPEFDSGTTLRTNFFGSIGFVQGKGARFLLRGDAYMYSPGEAEEVWHRPAYKVTADIGFNIYQKVLLDLSMIAQGGVKAKRYISSTNFETVDLDPALDLNARLEYIVSDSFSMFVRANNILSSEYPLFLNYPVRGFQILGGISIRF